MIVFFLETFIYKNADIIAMARSAYPDVFTLEGEVLKDFLEYDKRELSTKEKNMLNEALEFYQEQCKKDPVNEI